VRRRFGEEQFRNADPSDFCTRSLPATWLNALSQRNGVFFAIGARCFVSVGGLSNEVDIPALGNELFRWADRGLVTERTVKVNKVRG
jgi:hypothetical protein